MVMQQPLPKFFPAVAVQCLYTTLRNLRPASTFYGFLPPHGRRLLPCEEFLVAGDMMSEFKRQTHNGRARRAFESALADGDIALVNGPAVHMHDLVLDETKVVTLANGSPVLADPCWGTYTSSMCPSPSLENR